MEFGSEGNGATLTDGATTTVAPLAEVESDFDATFTPTPQNAADDDEIVLSHVENDTNREGEGEEEEESFVPHEASAIEDQGDDDIYMVLEGPCVEESCTDTQEANQEDDPISG